MSLKIFCIAAWVIYGSELSVSKFVILSVILLTVRRLLKLMKTLKKIRSDRSSQIFVENVLPPDECYGV